jgi:hypothetical protein
VDTYNGSPSDIDNADYDYDVEGLYALMTYEKGQYNLFGRHGKRGAKALKCLRRLRERKGDPTMKCIS